MNQKFSKGGLIFSEGEPGDCAYIIETGNVELSILVQGCRRKISELPKGSLFGEMALVGDHLRTASAMAIEDTELIVIPEKYFKDRLDNSDPFISLLLRLMLHRYLDMRIRMDLIVNQSRGDLPLMVCDKAAPDCEQDTVNAARKLEAENNLKNALDTGQLELFYQPIIALSAGTTIGCEALLRWRHPQKGLVSPIEFIDLAEETGLIIPIGIWIIEQAIQAYHDFIKPENRFAFVSINLSGRQFEAEDLIDNIQRIFKHQEIDPKKIKFEITESILMANPLEMETKLAALKQFGASIAIDDFGTGYSSFSYLHRFPIDTLKIDRSFVSTMRDNAKSHEIVKSLALLAKALGMSVVAEGVETFEEHRLLRELGVDYGQGYYYSRPMELSKFRDFLGQAQSFL